MKKILEQYSAALSRVKNLRQQMWKKENKLAEMNKRGYYVVDVVTCGRKRKKALGKVTIAGYPHEAYKKYKESYEKQYNILKHEEQELLDLVTKVEEYITGIDDIEMRDILTLYYIEDLNWVQVAGKMNINAKNKVYTADSCRCKHNNFLEKNKKI